MRALRPPHRLRLRQRQSMRQPPQRQTCGILSSKQYPHNRLHRHPPAQRRLKVYHTHKQKSMPHFFVGVSSWPRGFEDRWSCGPQLTLHAVVPNHSGTPEPPSAAPAAPSPMDTCFRKAFQKADRKQEQRQLSCHEARRYCFFFSMSFWYSAALREPVRQALECVRVASVTPTNGSCGSGGSNAAKKYSR